MYSGRSGLPMTSRQHRKHGDGQAEGDMKNSDRKTHRATSDVLHTAADHRITNARNPKQCIRLRRKRRGHSAVNAMPSLGGDCRTDHSSHDAGCPACAGDSPLIGVSPLERSLFSKIPVDHCSIKSDSSSCFLHVLRLILNSSSLSSTNIVVVARSLPRDKLQLR